MIRPLKQLFRELAPSSMVGVDFGSAAIKVVELARDNGRVVLRRCAVTPAAGGDRTLTLRKACAEAGITNPHVAMGLASPELVVRPFQFPRMNRKQLKAAMQLEAEQAILNGHKLTDMAVDWHLIPSDSKESVRGVCAVVPKKELESRLEIARSAGLQPVVVDVEALALWDAYWTLVGKREAAESKAVLLLNVGARTTNLVVAKGSSELILMRDFRIGTQASDEKLGREWVTEVRDSLRYAHSKGGASWELGAVYLTGGGSSRVDLPALCKAIGVNVKLWNPLDDLTRETQGPSGEDYSVGPLLTVAIGLGLRSHG